MRRKTIIDGLQKITTDIQNSGVVDLMQGIIQRAEKKDSALNILPVFQSLLLSYHTYSEDERHLVNLLEISRVYTVDFWTPFLEKTTDNNFPTHLYPMYGALQSALVISGRFVNILKNDRVEIVLANDPKAPQILRDKDLLTLILPETNDQFSSPARVAFAIEAVDLLYKAYAQMFGLETGDLVILSCDSGSDKSFDFTGLPQVIQSVKDTVFGIWDRIVFHSHSQQHANLKLIAESLPVYEKIGQMVDSKSMSPEQGEILRRQVIAAATKFIEAGATIPELDSRALNSPRELMAPERKLLAGPSQQASPANTSDTAPRPRSEEQANESYLLKRIEELEAEIQKKSSAPKPAKRKLTAKTIRKPTTTSKN
ncbi:hypothetical protein ACQZ5N_06935 [Agrobacterium sp. 22-221-1]